MMEEEPSKKVLSEELNALKIFSESKRLLKELNIVRSERIIGEIGEWYFLRLFGGKLATRTSEKGWDIQRDNGSKVQIKTHAKSLDNNARWTELSLASRSYFDELFVFVFSPNLILYGIFSKPKADLPAEKKIIDWKDLDLIDPEILNDNKFFGELKSSGMIDYRDSRGRRMT
jgi:hypothetical protein